LKGNKLTRETIIQKLTDVLEPLDHVHAFYEGGAVAFKRVDEWSDLDLYVVVDDDKVQETFIAFEKALEKLSPIAQKLDVPQLPWPGVSQAFYKLQKASEYLLIDLAVLKLNSPEKFLEPSIHGNVVFYFNKSQLKSPRFDKTEFIKKLRQRLERLRLRFTLFNVFVQKEINRGNTLEAIDLYHNFTLASLVEALRMKHMPLHYDFKMRYVHYELPRKTILKLEDLYLVKDEKDLQEKYDRATKWFQKIISQLMSND
jgi:predicted nucleotidyltransferase